MNTKNIINALICGASLLMVSRAAAANLIVNGDFQAGSTGFNTSYSPNLIGSTENSYSVVNNPNGSAPAQNALATSYYDKTLGTAAGLMMAVNGAGNASTLVWGQTVIGLTVGQQYEFGLWVSTWYAANPAILDVKIDGLLQTNFSAPTATGQWVKHSFVWTATATTAVAAIYDNNTLIQGNDFALDDISLTARTSVPDGGSAIALLGSALMGLGLLRRKRVA